MKTYLSDKLFHFILALFILSATLGLFIYIGNQGAEISTKTLASSQKDSLETKYFQTKELPPTTLAAPASALNSNNPKPSILTEWDVKGWKLNCPIEPLLNAHEKGKVVFRVKINENGRLVALEPISNLSNLSEENIQSFKTTIELEIESCLERKNVKIEPISNGTVSFFVN
ncbi:MAG: hypothetical protein ACK40K_00340 [Raineya sp.]